MARTTQPSAIDDILAEHSGLEQQLADPALHNDPAAARKLMLTAPRANPSAVERELFEFGRQHRDCNIRILAD